MKITLDGTPKEIAQILQVLQVKQPQITTGAIAAEKLEDSLIKEGIGAWPYKAEAIPVSSNAPSAKLDSHAVTTDRIADHGITYDRLAVRPAEEEQR